jgi:putative transposase
MPRARRADEAGGLYHALNRGNGRARIFRKTGVYEAFERILSAGRERTKQKVLTLLIAPGKGTLIFANPHG